MSNQYTRKSHCLNGHEFLGNNLLILKNGWRVCKICQRAAIKKYHLSEKGKEKGKAYRKANKLKRLEDARKRREMRRRLVYKVKNVPCTDCNVNYPPYVMDLDHVKGNKLFDVSTMVDMAFSIKRIKEEISKCEVVCSNCHRVRTNKRKQNVKTN